ncbi:energy transducer TonB [Chryseobacterium foetidum]|uniref:energy transducer TonB n=1 Tax=Chryseobacterium foetidum TaxID=2951057 RepID=UPI0021C7A195|nr:energy transducer TonB [Chryseobacterium foetidum]
MKKIVLFFVLTGGFFNAQILEKYPKDQEDYEGGNIQFYKDFHRVLTEKNLKPCEDKNEMYSFKLVVYPDSTIKYVKEENEEALEKNKCTHDLSREVAKHLKGWKPAEVDGQKVASQTSFWIIPDELFKELPEGYDPAKDYKITEYEGGINNFRKKVAKSVDLSKFNFKSTVRIHVKFIINTDGEMSDIKLEESSGLKEFDDMIIESVAKVKNKWTPANIHGRPVRSQFRLPLTISL